MFISGTLHGNEIVGPNSAYYFIELIASSFQKQDKFGERLREMLKNLEIVITPMTNSNGYYRNEREEELSHSAQKNLVNNGLQSSHTKSRDINRDFPFDMDSRE